MKKVIIKKNRYIDSVTLMSVGDKIMKMTGIENAEVQMGTWANQEILTELGYEVPNDTGADDLVMAVIGDTEEHINNAFARIDNILEHRDDDDETHYQSLDEINFDETHYDLVQISVPGKYAFAEANKALDKGLNVFIFSDNVGLDEERKLKEKGKEKGLLVMGSDCGVGMIGGVCLAAGSIMNEGPVGIVAASGSGAQEVACILDRCNIGISSLIGTGGRDLYPEIGGIEMLQGIDLLEKDDATKVIVLVSKLADYEVMKKVLIYADSVKKPVVAVFLGSDKALFKGHKTIPAFSLEEAAYTTAKLISPNINLDFRFTGEQIKKIVNDEIKQYDNEQKYFRGIYCGGTFTEEGLLHYSKIPNIKLYSNLDTKYAQKLQDSEVSLGHSILDMGAEDYTCKAPHPIFDPQLRIKRLVKELEDKETAVILLDFITGPGVAEDPITPVAEAIKNFKTKKHITYIANICGSKQDPQNITQKANLLKDAGVIVTASSYESARLAGALMEELERRN